MTSAAPEQASTRPLVTRNSTFPVVSFRSFDNEVLQVKVTEREDQRIAGPLVGLTTDKGIGDSNGTWRVRLKPHVTDSRHRHAGWHEVVTEGDWVQIDVSKNGVDYALMAGRVDEVVTGIDAGGEGEGDAYVEISGKDPQGALVDTPVYFNPYDAQRDNAAGLDVLRITDGRVSGRADELVPALIEGFMGRGGGLGGSVQVPPGISGAAESLWVDGFDSRSLVQSELRGITFRPQVLTQQNYGSVWDFVGDWRNPVLNELWVDTPADTDDRTWYLRLRERPFVNNDEGDSSPWFDLPAHDVHVGTCSNVRIGRGRHRVNHVMVVGDLIPAFAKDVYALYRPFANGDSIKRYGLRRLEETTRFFDGAPQGEADFVRTHREWLSLVVSWNALNHRHWQGSISIGELRPEIKVGDRVRLTGPLSLYEPTLPSGAEGDDALTFYVEHVRHEVREGRTPVARTTLDVTRGFVDSARADALAEELRSWTGADLIPTTTGTGDYLRGNAARDGVLA